MNSDRAIEQALSRIDQDVVTRLAVDLVSIPSPTGSERAVAEFVAEHMARGGLEVTLQEIGPTRANAIGIVRGEGDGPRLMFNGHLDTSITGIDAEDYPMTGPSGPAAPREGLRQGRPRARLRRLQHEGRHRRHGVSAAIAVKQAGVPLRGDLIVGRRRRRDREGARQGAAPDLLRRRLRRRRRGHATPA